MMLTELTAVPAAALPVQPFKDHLRLGTGFADDGAQDGLAAAYLRAAMAAIEARTGKVLVARRFGWTLTHWRDAGEQALPLAPVRAIEALVMADRLGGETVVDPARYRLIPDMHRPRIAGAGRLLPSIPTGGTATVTIEAGFGPAWADVPADLAQAVFLLAAQYHEDRHDRGPGDAGMPFGVSALIERWRTVRVLGGGAA